MGSIPYSAPPAAPAPHEGPTTADTNSTPQACSKHENGILCIILLRPYLIATVAVICGAFLFLSYYQVLIRSLCSNNDSSFSRNSSQRRRLDEANSDNPSLQIRSRGLGYSVIQCLPISQFKPKDEEEGRRDNTNCAICLGEFEEGETIKRLPNCSHEFHAACIDTWFRSNSNCPLCGSRVDDLSVTVNILRETLRREEFFRVRKAHYLTVRAEVLQNAGHGLRGQLRTFHIIWVQKSSSDFGKKANLTAKVFPYRGPWNYKEIHSLL